MAGFQGRAAGEFPSVLAGQLDAVQAQVRVLEEVLAHLEADVTKALPNACSMTAVAVGNHGRAEAGFFDVQHRSQPTS